MGRLQGEVIVGCKYFVKYMGFATTWSFSVMFIVQTPCLPTVLGAYGLALPIASNAAAVIEPSTLPATPARRTLTWNCVSMIFICAYLSIQPSHPLAIGRSCNDG